MRRDVEIWIGIANTGKTRELLAVYRGALKSNAESSEFGRTLWLTPTNESRRQLLGQLTDEENSACFSPNIMTFPAFAETLLRSAGEPVEEISPVIKQRLIRTVIEELQHTDQLPYFSPIAATTGFPQLVMSFIAELKREEIWPEQFAEVSAAENQSDKDRELALIYTTYQNRLLNAKLYDSEGRFWAARDVADRSGLGPFANLSLVVVDGFSDFTHTQYELLAHLSRSAKRMRISLPLGTPQTREDVFAKPQTAFKKLTALLQPDGEMAIRNFPEEKQHSDESPPAISHLARQLFSNPHQASRSSNSIGLSIVAVTGPIREINFLAERVKRLLFLGVAAEDIVISFRTLNDDTINLVRERFLAAEIPFSLQTGLPFLREPLLRTLFDVVRLELEDWPFERLMSVLRSNLFRPEWDIPEIEIAAASSAVAKLLCERKLHSQRHIILQVLTREAKRSADLVEDDSLSETWRSSKKDNVKNLGSALSLLEYLSTATRKLQGERDFAQWVQRLTELARKLGIAPSATKSKSTNLSPEDAKQLHDDSQTWDHFERLLFDAAKADAFEPGTIRKLNSTEFLNAIVELLESQHLPTAGMVRGCVRILEASSVRNLDIPYLFLAGLTESNFPGSRSDDCFYSESERRRLNDQGLSLGHRSSHSQDELLLFYGVVTRARKMLVLSYSEVGSNGNPLFPSPYLKAIRDLFEPGSLTIQHVGSLDPVPSHDQILTTADWRRAATVDVHDRKPGLFAAFCDRSELQSVAANILAGIDVNVARFRTPGWTPYEGLIENPSLKKHLAAKYTADYQFSATQLESYAACGFRFLLSDVMKIEPLGSPHVVTDHMVRGNLAHAVLSAIHSEFEHTDVTDSNEPEAELVSLFRENVDRELGRRISETDLHKALIRIEGRLLYDWSEYYGEQWTEYIAEFGEAWDAMPVPQFLETPFGDVPGTDQETESENPSLAALELGKGADRTLIRGQIDRIDVGTANASPVFNIIDYKTGRPPRFSLDDVESGRSLQLALYTLAVLRFGLAGPNATPYQMAYWSLREIGFVSGLKGTTRKKQILPIDEAVLHSLESTLDNLIPKLAQGIREGVFPVDNDDPACTARCNYGSVCRVTQTRPVRELFEKHSKLTIIDRNNSEDNETIETP